MFITISNYITNWLYKDWVVKVKKLEKDLEHLNWMVDVKQNTIHESSITYCPAKIVY